MNDVDMARRAIALIDLTELGDAASADDVRALCAKAPGDAARPPVAAVCVWPRHAALARGLLPVRASPGPSGYPLPKRERVKVATVINFPTGDAPLKTVVAEAHEAVSNGADEIDLVMPYKAYLSGDTPAAMAMIEAVKAVLPPGRLLKVILETGAYPDQAAVRTASDVAIWAGADFIKTSTGKIAVGATLEAGRTMLTAIRESKRDVGFKPAGGIRTLADAKAWLALADELMGPDWARPETFRFGASGLLGALAGVVSGAGAGAPGKGY
jgi:deoxyribose-phosphate aldolase